MSELSDKHWSQMSYEERAAVQDEINMRNYNEIEDRRQSFRDRAKQIVNDSRIWSIPLLQVFVNRLNSLARKHGCLDKIPTQPFESIQAFLEATIPILMEHGITEEEIDFLRDTVSNLYKEKLG